MKLKDILQKNDVIAFEVIENQRILSVILKNDIRHALNVDTSNILAGTQLTVVDDFSIKNDILTVSNISLNVNEVEVITKSYD